MLPKSGHFQGRLAAMVSLAGFKVSSKAAKPTLLAGFEKKAADAIVSQVRDFLASLIPTYMIPSIWIVVEEIPQLVSGKLDRKTMSNWLVNLDERSCQLINPSSSDSVEMSALTDVEQKLRKIICQTLNLRESQVPLDQSFLRIGVILSLQDALAKILTPILGRFDQCHANGEHVPERRYWHYCPSYLEKQIFEAAGCVCARGKSPVLSRREA